MTVLVLRPPAMVSVTMVVTSFHPGPLGGGVLIGTDDRGISRRAGIPGRLLVRSPARGESWRVTGTETFNEAHGSTWISADVALPMPLAGEAIVRYLADNPRFAGVGRKTALKLRNCLGLEGLYRALKSRDHHAIAAVVGPELAAVIVSEIGLLDVEIETLAELEKIGVEGRTAGLAFSVWGGRAAAYLSAEPYALRLLLPWRQVDDRALRMGMLPSDERRQRAIVDEAFAARLRLGHTASTRAELSAAIRRIALRTTMVSPEAMIDHSVGSGSALRDESGLLQSRGAHWMERTIEREIAGRAARNPHQLDLKLVEAIVEGTSREAGHNLTPRQLEAIRCTLLWSLCAIAGGAGTGKTTVVRAVANALAERSRVQSCGRSDFTIVLSAVAGRAARRLQEATGRSAMTVARLLFSLQQGQLNLAGCAVVVDEASMLDLQQVYRLLTLLPRDCALIFVGDPEQLPPIGPGQFFKALTNSSVVPVIELDAVHRHDSDSGIAAVAWDVRHGRLPRLPLFDPRFPLRPGVFVLPSARDRAAVFEGSFGAFHAMAGPVPLRGAVDALHEREVQVISPTKHGPAGTLAMNGAIENMYMRNQERVSGWGFSIGTKILWLKNDYQRAPLRSPDGEVDLDEQSGEPACLGLMNGSLGIVRRHAETAGHARSWVEFDDGASDWISERDLDASTLGWAVTIHKAQGSAFKNVLVPVAKNRLLDRAMIYTAITRAISTCVLVGDLDYLRGVVAEAPKAHQRRTCMRI